MTFSTHRALYIPRLLADKAVVATAVETPSGWEDRRARVAPWGRHVPYL